VVKNYQLIGDGMYAISAVLGYALPALGVMMVPIHLEALNVANAHLDVWSRSSLDNLPLMNIINIVVMIFINGNDYYLF
jgi:hypothetical protein